MLSPEQSATFVSTPVLILNGTKDRHTTVSDAKRLFHAFQGPKQLELFEGAGHVDLLNFDQALYEAKVSEFLLQLLPESPND